MAKKTNRRPTRLAQLLACRNVGQVIALLRKARAKADEENYGATSCPIANYLNRSGKYVAVCDSYIDINDEIVPVTRPIRTFVTQFDAGKLPMFHA